MRRAGIRLLWLFLATCSGAAPAPKPNAVAKPAIAVTAPPPPVAPAGRPQVTLVPNSDGAGSLTSTLDPVKPAAAGALVSTLSQRETDALIARLEPLPDLSGKPAPVMRAPSLAPPANGTITPIAFVGPVGTTIADKPVAAPASAPPPPLPAPQILPTGEVPMESQIRVRFEDAMVAVSAIGSSPPPAVTITPQVAGTWRWVDTRVAEFTAAGGRLPQATDFTVTVAAGARSVTGSTLRAAATGTFSTPPVQINGSFPAYTKLRPDSAIAVTFDQDIDPAQIAKFLRVEVGKGKRTPVAFRTVDLAEARALWAKNPSLKLDEQKLGKHHVIIAPKTAWPSGAEGRIVLGKGAPSQEGSRVTTRETDVAFVIAPLLRLVGLACDNEPRMTNVTCAARSSVWVSFSNAIDEKSYRSNKVQIAGTAFQDVSLHGDNVSLDVPDVIGATYSVVIGDGLVDIYGQPFTGTHTASFATKRVHFDPELTASTGLYVLDPRYTIPQWSVHAEAVSSLHVELYQVTPADYFAFEAFEAGKRATPPGKRVYDKVHVIGARQAGDAHVDLSPALHDGIGHVIAVASVPATKREYFEPRAAAWIEVTKLAVSARYDREKSAVWVQDIAVDHSLAPIAGATTSVVVNGHGTVIPPVTTDAEGHATFDFVAPITRKPDEPHDALLLAEHAGDSAFVATSRFEKTARNHQARWYVTDDRFIYKPGEKVYVKGWVRWTHDGVNPDISLPATGDRVGYSLTDSRGNRIGSGTADLDDHGGFDLEVALPANANLGTAWFQFDTKTATDRWPIKIEEFRTPAYAVTLNDDVTHGGARPVVVGESLEMLAEAKYYAGGGLAGATVDWSATLEGASYRPPGWDMYSFSPVMPRGFREHYGSLGAYSISDRKTTALSGASTSSIVYAIGALPNKLPSVLTVDSTVTDIDRMTIRASSRKILVHPSDYYVGLRKISDEGLQAIVTDIDGTPVPGVDIDVTIEGVLGSERYRADAEIKDTQHCKVASAATPVACTWHSKDDKYQYRAVARIADGRGRVNTAEYDVPWWTTSDKHSDLEITADKKEYRPGQTAKLAIHSTRLPATAVVTFARNGVVSQKQLVLRTETTPVELPIEAGYIKNIHVVVDRFAERPSSTKKSPKPLPDHGSATLDIPVDIEGARLITTAKATKPVVEPGANATFEVQVSRDDKPVAGAEVALIVVDEAVLALSGERHKDPLAPFYSTVPEGTWQVTSLSAIRDAGDELADQPGFERTNLDELGRGGGGTGWGTIGSGQYGTIGHGSGTGSAIVEARKDFRANALFAPRLVTDARGRATATVKMPDSLTRFRIVALTSAEAHYFGLGESTIITQRKINARTVAPRFLSQGDTFALPVVVQNLDAVPRTVDVAVRAANLTAAGPQGKRVTVPPGARAEVRFDFATRARGQVAIQTIAVAGDFADASQVQLPVYEPATTEAFATYGVVDDAPKFERLDVPSDIFTEVGGVEAEVSSTQLQALTDAYWYLYAYPYECAEQRSSRMLATSAMADILDAFAVPGRPTRKELDDQRARDVGKLLKDQRADGGWGYFWDMQSDPYVSIQVYSALIASRQINNGIKLAHTYVDGLASKKIVALEQAAKTPIRGSRANEPYDVALAASALTALGAAGFDVSARALRLHAAATALGSYPMDAKARLLALLAKQPGAKAVRDKLKADILSAAHETAAGATIATSYVDAERLLLPSSNKTTALALDALIREAPQEPLVDKLARGLLGARKRGRWSTTQENLAVMQAMRHYFDVYEKDTPSYTGKLWFGTAAYAEQTFAGRSQLRATTKLDWTQLGANSRNDIALQKSGPGRMYYRIGITYAPKQANLPPLDAGFVVRRSYEGAENPSDVVHLPDGTWKIKLGAKVRVVLETVNTTTRYAVALADPLPAGLESVNTRLATAERDAGGATDADWDHTEMRDNRSEAFAMTLREGTHRWVYTARATTPGKFIAAPTKAEEMYSPETFGRSSGSVVVVESP